MRVYVLFVNAQHGMETRTQYKEMMKRDDAHPSWTPIERISKTFRVTAGSLLTITRNQIPMTPAAASTIHSAQSTTQKRIMVSVNGLNRKLLYTALQSNIS